MSKLKILMLGCLASVAAAGADVADSWDWSLPPGTRPAARSGISIGGKAPANYPGKRLANVAWTWARIEPVEGRYDFDSLREAILEASRHCDGVILYVRGSTWKTEILRNGKQVSEPGAAPEWLKTSYHVPTAPEARKTNLATPFTVYNYEISSPEFHRRYLKMVEALGESGIPQMRQVMFAYVHGVSASRGEEWTPVQLPPDAATMKERLRAWAQAFHGVEYKLAWVGNSGELLSYAYSLGMGQRTGFVEMYLMHCQNPQLGQSLDANGYLVVDEKVPPIAENRAFGDENEEYVPEVHVPRFGPVETWPHRYRESMLRALEMRRNFLWAEPNAWVDPPLLNYVSLELGRNVKDTPDIWCYLRESHIMDQKQVRPVKNFERWLYQRDREGVRTVPAVKVEHPIDRIASGVPKDFKHDSIARRPDPRGGNGRIGFAVDDRFLSGGPHNVTIKVTYHDCGTGEWALLYETPKGPAEQMVNLTNTGKVRTATFLIGDASFGARGLDFDFSIDGRGSAAAFSFVRVIKAARGRNQ
ncbi:MAG: beta-galactosidase [Acidobacteria bacterium]|nr:beta-galactosidase [Acidobacteriota bacterium]